MIVDQRDFDEAFNFIRPAVLAILSANNPQNGFHILAFKLDSAPTTIAERAYGDPGMPGRTYRMICGLKAAIMDEHKMSIEDMREVNPDILERRHIHDGSVIDIDNKFGIVGAGVGGIGNISLTRIVYERVLELAAQRTPGTIAAE